MVFSTPTEKSHVGICLPKHPPLEEDASNVYGVKDEATASGGDGFDYSPLTILRAGRPFAHTLQLSPPLRSHETEYPNSLLVKLCKKHNHGTTAADASWCAKYGPVDGNVTTLDEQLWSPNHATLEARGQSPRGATNALNEAEQRQTYSPRGPHRPVRTSKAKAQRVSLKIPDTAFSGALHKYFPELQQQLQKAIDSATQRIKAEQQLVTAAQQQAHADLLAEVMQLKQSTPRNTNRRDQTLRAEELLLRNNVPHAVLGYLRLKPTYAAREAAEKKSTEAPAKTEGMLPVAGLGEHLTGVAKTAVRSVCYYTFRLFEGAAQVCTYVTQSGLVQMVMFGMTIYTFFLPR